MLLLAKGLGRVSYFTEPEAQALLELKDQWGFKDPRNEMKSCDICANDVFRDSWKASGVEAKAFEPPHYRSDSCSADTACALPAREASSNGDGESTTGGTGILPVLQAQALARRQCHPAG
jgi:hypothetical protein